MSRSLQFRVLYFEFRVYNLAMNYRLTDHAREEMIRRGIVASWLETLMAKPEQIIPSRERRQIYQSQFTDQNGKLFLLRAVVDHTEVPVAIVTMYRTSKIEKYWSVK